MTIAGRDVVDRTRRALVDAHRLTDVLAGGLLGAAWPAVVLTAHRLFPTARRRDRGARPAASWEEGRRV